MKQSDFERADEVTITAGLIRNIQRLANKHDVFTARDRQDLQNLVFLVIEDAQPVEAQ